MDTAHFKKYYKKDKIDRTVVRLPGAEHLALIYNKKEELKSLAYKEKHFQETGREMKPLAEIPELGLMLYSRCLVCRIDTDGEPASLEDGDGEVVTKYLAE